MNGVVKTDETDSVASMPVSTAEKPGHESAVIQPQGIGPAIHLNGSSVPVPEDQPVQVGPFKYNSVNHSIFALESFFHFSALDRFTNLWLNNANQIEYISIS